MPIALFGVWLRPHCCRQQLDATTSTHADHPECHHDEHMGGRRALHVRCPQRLCCRAYICCSCRHTHNTAAVSMAGPCCVSEGRATSAHLVLVHSCLASLVSIWKSIRAREISRRCSSDLAANSRQTRSKTPAGACESIDNAGHWALHIYAADHALPLKACRCCRSAKHHPTAPASKSSLGSPDIAWSHRTTAFEKCAHPTSHSNVHTDCVQWHSLHVQTCC